MNGSIGLTSTPRVGSTATFTLPLKISRWTGDVPIARSASEAQIQAQSFRRGSIHRDILNQEISNIVTAGPEVPLLEQHTKSLSGQKRDAGDLTMEERKRVHVLVVEDK